MESSPLSEDLDLGHEDNEPHMIKGELYKIGKYAMELYQMVDQFEGQGEVDFPAWWQSKVTKACSMISSAKHYLEFELKEPEIDAMVGVASDEEILDNEIEEGIHDRDITSAPQTNVKGTMGDYDPKKRAASLAKLKNFGPKGKEIKEDEIGKDEILAGKLYKIKNFVQPAFYQKIRSLINSGDLETAEYIISRMEPAAAKNDREMAKMKGDLEDIDAVTSQRKRERQMANIFTEELKDIRGGRVKTCGKCQLSRRLMGKRPNSPTRQGASGLRAGEAFFRKLAKEAMDRGADWRLLPAEVAEITSKECAYCGSR